MLSRNGDSKNDNSPIANTESVTPSLQSIEPNPAVAQGFFNTPPPLITDKLSIAVLPFINMSKDEDQEFFADGMTEDIITGLSCDSRLFVKATLKVWNRRNSCCYSAMKQMRGLRWPSSSSFCKRRVNFPRH
ncbi:MAG: hypothetical protein KBT88_06170 [Gammaproteobacteria bacterium]|nr:hypothetical protein [Gammaproteobacteria bacterium]